MRLIDADKLKAVWIRFKKSDIADGGGFVYDPDDVIETIDESETVEAEPVKHGRWKKSKKEKMYCDWEMNGWFDYPEICTNCGYDATEDGMGVGNYCPNCGAKMDLVGEKNERV